MRLDEIKWHPIRIQATRERRGEWTISRAGDVVGHVYQTRDGKWQSSRKVLVHNARRPLDVMRAYANVHDVTHPSFKTAVLRLTRLAGLWAGSDGPQDWGLVRMIRVHAGGSWYAVIMDEGAHEGERRESDQSLHGYYVYRCGLPEGLTDTQQAQLRLVVNEAAKWAKENLPERWPGNLLRELVEGDESRSRVSP